MMATRFALSIWLMLQAFLEVMHQIGTQERSLAQVYPVMTRMRAASLGCLKILFINSLLTFQLSFRLSDRVFYPKAHFSISRKK
jgi:hypothetical protein